SVVMARCDRLLKRLKASRLDGTYEAEMRRLIAVDLLVLDDFAIHRMDAAETGTSTSSSSSATAAAPSSPCPTGSRRSGWRPWPIPSSLRGRWTASSTAPMSWYSTGRATDDARSREWRGHAEPDLPCPGS